MITNIEQKTMEMEARDINYILPSYVRTYLFISKNEDPDRIIFPMFPSIPHPHKKGQTIPIEYVPYLGEVAVAIAKDGKDIAEVTPQQEAALDEKDDEIKRLRAQLGSITDNDTQPEEPKVQSSAKAAFANIESTTQPARQPKQPPGGDLGAGTPLSDMGKRDIGDQKFTAKALSDEPSIDESKDKPFDKTVTRDDKGKPVVEDGK